MKRHALPASLLALLLLQAGPLLAASPLYDVEVIVFANDHPDDQGEQWPVRIEDKADGIYMDNRITALPRESGSLDGVRNSLQRHGHQVLLHRRWRQPASSKSSGAYRVRGNVDGSRPVLDGYIRLLRGRYLHLEVDLTMSEARQPQYPGAFNPDASPAAASYHLQEKRRVRQTELHYFDHPRFGVLARVTRHEVADEDSEADGEAPAEAADAGT